MKPLVYIILVNYKGFSDTVECIDSIEKVNYDNYKIVVVDNDSKDGSFEALRKKYPEHIIIEAGKNLGFAGGNNIGISLALKENADYVMLLNNDTVVEADFLDKIIETAVRHKDAGIVGGKICYYNDRNVVSHAGGYIDMFKFTTGHYGMNETDNEELNKEKEVTFISGCLMLIKKEAAEKVGLLEDEYFMYYEDTDYCMRMLDKGFKLVYSPKAVIYHKISKSSGGENSPFFLKWNTRNRIIFMNKFKSRISRTQFFLSNIYVYLTRLVRYMDFTLKGDKKRAGAVMEGIREGRKYIKEKGI